MAEDTYYVDVQPAPDSKITVSTGPLVPADSDEVTEAKGSAAAGDDNDSNPQNDKKEAAPAAKQKVAGKDASADDKDNK